MPLWGQYIREQCANNPEPAFPFSPSHAHRGLSSFALTPSNESTYGAGGGGGGAGQVGQDGVPGYIILPSYNIGEEAFAGNGGSGTLSQLLNQYFGGGGGGGCFAGMGGLGGLGGGGDGGSDSVFTLWNSNGPGSGIPNLENTAKYQGRGRDGKANSGGGGGGQGSDLQNDGASPGGERGGNGGSGYVFVRYYKKAT